MIAEKIINDNGSTIVDLSTNIVHENQQNNMYPAQTADYPCDKDSYKPIRLVMDNGHRKVDLYRVIMALSQEGFFKSAGGGDAAIKDVFHAFGVMLDEKFDTYANDLNAGSKAYDETKNAIFSRLSKAYIEYEDKKLEEKQRK